MAKFTDIGSLSFVSVEILCCETCVQTDEANGPGILHQATDLTEYLLTAFIQLQQFY
jgi:hypothetical protein